MKTIRRPPDRDQAYGIIVSVGDGLDATTIPVRWRKPRTRDELEIGTIAQKTLSVLGLTHCTASHSWLATNARTLPLAGPATKIPI